MAIAYTDNIYITSARLADGWVEAWLHSETDTTATIYWGIGCRQKSAALYGQEAYGYVDGSNVGYTSGYITSSSSSWKQVCSTSGYVTVNKTTAARNVPVSVDTRVCVVDGYGSVTTDWVSASVSVSIKAKTSYAVKYDANGGSGAPSAQVKWHGTDLTLSSTKPTRTGYTFQGWGTSASDTSKDYDPGDDYTTNAAITLYAIWKANTYTITFNANGGTLPSGLSTQTKTYGVALTLSDKVPTRTNYNFLGWATSASATTAKYQPGGSFTTNAKTTLYAVWELAYTLPVITSLKANRCDSDGTLNDFGLYAKVTFKWSVCTIISGISVSSVKVTCNGTTTTISASGTSGSVSQIVGEGALSVESQYAVTATVVDSKEGSTTSSTTLAKAAFTIDFLAGGGGAAFGKPAEKSGLEISWKSYLYDHLYLANAKYLQAMNADGNARNVFGMNSSNNLLIGYGLYSNGEGATCIYGGDYVNVFSKGGNGINTLTGGVIFAEGDDLNDYLTVGNYYSGTSTLSASLVNAPYTGGSFCLKVMCPYGTNISGNNVVIQEVITTLGRRYIRRSGDSGATWSTWRRVYGETVLYNNSSGTAGTVTLSETAANFTYLEIFFTDNNNSYVGSVRVSSPNGKETVLTLIEGNSSSNTFIRRTIYTISGTSLKPSTTTGERGYISFQTGSWYGEYTSNYIKVLRVVGHV